LSGATGSGRVSAVDIRGAAVSRAQVLLGVATILAYAVGYPVAIIGGYAIGWALVMLGGVLLLALGIVTVRRIHRAASGT
jgi:putative Mn2+ efflux pump MntP